ncbi:MAG TPA: DUF4199 domain-containing protein [Croceibacterium sp.]
MRYVLVYGTIAGAITIAAISSSFVFEDLNHLQTEWFGYLVMLVALSLIFAGVKRYRDVECGGVVGFGRALLLGLGIALVAGAIYVAGWEAYLATSEGNFIETYATGVLADMRASGASAAEIAATERDMAWAIEIYAQPLPRMGMTFLEIFPVGLLVALLSAAVLRNPRVLPAGNPSARNSTGSPDEAGPEATRDA